MPGAKRRVVVTGGGTAGHILTALDVLAAYQREFGATGCFIGSSAGFEARIVSTHGEELELIPGLPWARQPWTGKLGALAAIPPGLVAAGGILSRRRAEVVIGVGGYVSFTVCLAAKCLGIPVVIHEANAVPGLANSLIGRFAALVCVGDADVARQFRHTRAIVTGNPCAQLHRSDGAGPPRFLVSGGSEGSPVLNRQAPRLFAELRNRIPGFSVLHITGLNHTGDPAPAYREARVNAHLERFLNDISAIYDGVSLAVVSPGARTLAELAELGIPAILSPLPGAAHRHQIANAQRYSAATGARVALTPDWDIPSLAHWVEGALGSSAREEYRRRSRTLVRPDAARDIAAACEQLFG